MKMGKTWRKLNKVRKIEIFSSLFLTPFHCFFFIVSQFLLFFFSFCLFFFIFAQLFTLFSHDFSISSLFLTFSQSHRLAIAGFSMTDQRRHRQRHKRNGHSDGIKFLPSSIVFSPLSFLHHSYSHSHRVRLLLLCKKVHSIASCHHSTLTTTPETHICCPSFVHCRSVCL